MSARLLPLSPGLTEMRCFPSRDLPNLPAMGPHGSRVPQPALQITTLSRRAIGLARQGKERKGNVMLFYALPYSMFSLPSFLPSLEVFIFQVARRRKPHSLGQEWSGTLVRATMEGFGWKKKKKRKEKKTKRSPIASVSAIRVALWPCGACISL